MYGPIVKRAKQPGRSAGVPVLKKNTPRDASRGRHQDNRLESAVQQHYIDIIQCHDAHQLLGAGAMQPVLPNPCQGMRLIQRMVGKGLDPGTMVVINTGNRKGEQAEITGKWYHPKTLEYIGYWIKLTDGFKAPLFFSELDPVMTTGLDEKDENLDEEEEKTQKTYGLSLIESCYGTTFTDTGGGKQRTSGDTSVEDDIKFHLTVLKSDPTQVHVSYYPLEDSEYHNKIIHCNFVWDSGQYRETGTILGKWKPYKKKFGTLKQHAQTVVTRLAQAIGKIIK